MWDVLYVHICAVWHTIINYSYIFSLYYIKHKWPHVPQAINNT